MEKTLVLIKPDAIEKNKIGKIISMYEDKGLTVSDCYMCVPNRDVLAAHYEEHKDKYFYPRLIDFMSSGKVMALLISGDNSVELVREINGATDPEDSKPGTVRYLYGTNVSKNAVHGSATTEDAKREVSIWFPDCK